MANMPRPDAVFEITDWECDTGAAALRLNYTCSIYGRFTEVIQFPAELAPRFNEFCEVHGLVIDIAHRILGVSYYKAAAAPRIVVRRKLTGTAELEALRVLYSKGLGEFFFRNNLGYPPKQEWIAPQDYSAGAVETKADDGLVLQAFGGGKESQVARHLLSRTSRRVRLASVSLTEETAKVIALTAREPVYDVRRLIDPRLLEANRSGALNGHVPVTAMNSATLLMAAAMLNASWLVFGNEAAAEEPTLALGEMRINHQFSKTLEWEKLFSTAAANVMPQGFCYFSLLRPLSEISVAGCLSRCPEALSVFRSCNLNFRQDASLHPGTERWCGACAKCAFTALMLAPFLCPDASRSVFGSQLLDNGALLEEYRSIAGLTAQKPWDCVGSVKEARAVFARLNADPRWRNFCVVREIVAELGASCDLHTLENDFEAAFSFRGPHIIPPDAYAVLEREMR